MLTQRNFIQFFSISFISHADDERAKKFSWSRFMNVMKTSSWKTLNTTECIVVMSDGLVICPGVWHLMRKVAARMKRMRMKVRMKTTTNQFVEWEKEMNSIFFLDSWTSGKMLSCISFHDDDEKFLKFYNLSKRQKDGNGTKTSFFCDIFLSSKIDFLVLSLFNLILIYCESSEMKLKFVFGKCSTKCSHNGATFVIQWILRFFSWIDNAIWWVLKLGTKICDTFEF